MNTTKIEIEEIPLERYDLASTFRKDIPLLSIRPNGGDEKRRFLIYLKTQNMVKLVVDIITGSSGSTPSCIATDSAIFIGFGFCVYIHNMYNDTTSRIKSSTAFFEFLTSPKVIISVHEAEIVFFDVYGNLLKHEYFDDIVTGAEVLENNQISVKFYEGGGAIINIPIF